MGKPNKPARAFAAINRNLCNHPFARDARVAIEWRKSAKTGRWLCDLPDVGIQFRLPEYTAKASRRWPTGFDTNLLFLLLSEAKKRDSTEVEFPSYSAILSLLGYNLEARNRRRLKAALALWSELMLWFERWRVPHRYSYRDKGGRLHAEYRKGTVKGIMNKRDVHGEHVRKQLPPPFKHISEQRRCIRITVDDEWRELGERFFAQVDLPLPRDASAQNLLLCIVTSKFQDGGDGVKYTGSRRVRELCRAIGLDHHNRSTKLKHTLAILKDWFKGNGRQFDWYLPPGKGNRIAFYITKGVVADPTRNEAIQQPIGDTHLASVPVLRATSDGLVDDRDDDVDRLMDEFDAENEANGIVFDNAYDAELQFKAWTKQRARGTMTDRGGKRRKAMTNVGGER